MNFCHFPAVSFNVVRTYMLLFADFDFFSTLANCPIPLKGLSRTARHSGQFFFFYFPIHFCPDVSFFHFPRFFGGGGGGSNYVARAGEEKIVPLCFLFLPNCYGFFPLCLQALLFILFPLFVQFDEYFCKKKKKCSREKNFFLPNR